MDYERKITGKWLGWIIRKKLGIKTQRSHGEHVVPRSETPKLQRLFEKYAVGKDEEAAGNVQSEQEI